MRFSHLKEEEDLIQMREIVSIANHIFKQKSLQN